MVPSPKARGHELSDEAAAFPTKLPQREPRASPERAMTASASAPATVVEPAFFLSPLRHTKTVYLIRHGEGYHNVAGEIDHDLYRSELYADAHLTRKGWEQCAALKSHIDAATTHDGKDSLVDRLELVVVSPLMRALETAVGCLGGDTVVETESVGSLLATATDPAEEIRPGNPAIAARRTRLRDPLPFVACELCREHIGLNPCDRRGAISGYAVRFPGVDFSGIPETDELWGTMNESNAAMCERAARFMRWLMLRPEREIAVVTHSAFMSAMLREFGADERLGCTPAVTEETRRWPNNCELRPMMLVDPGGGGGHDPMFFLGGDTAAERGAKT